MKTHILPFLGCMLLATSVLADSYTLTIPAGASRFIANQLNNSAGNTLEVVIPNPTGARDGDEIEKYNCSGYTLYLFNSTVPSGFTDLNGNPVPAPTLAPGEGALYVNNKGVDTPIVFTGTRPIPNLPASLPCGCGNLNILSRQFPGAGTYENVVGRPPEEGASVSRWNGNTFVTYGYSSGSWAPDVPALNPGEAAAFWVPCSCLNFQCATNKTTPCGSAWDFDPPTSLTACCGGDITVAILDTETNEVCPQTVTRTWLIADACGHSNTCSQAVTILDVTPPTISCPSNMVVVSDGPAGAVVPYSVTAFDNCSSNVNLVCSPPPCSTFPLGTNTVICCASDCSGNTNCCSFTITVVANADVAGGVSSQGFTHVAFGGASLMDSMNGLTVTALTQPGAFGATMELGESDGFEWNTVLSPSAAIGATLVSRGWGRVDGVPDQPFYSLGLEVEPGGVLQVQAPDFSAIGAATYTMRLYQAGTLVFQQSGMTNSPGSFLNNSGPKRCCARLIPPKVYWLIGRLATDGDADFAVSGGSTFQADRIEFLPDDPARQIDSLQRVSEEASGMPDFQLREEALVLFDNEHSAIGSARLYADAGTLAVTAASSGDSPGVAIELYNNSLPDLSLKPVDLTDPNAALDFSVIAAFPGDIEGLFGQVLLQGAGSNQLSVSVNVGGGGTNAVNVQVLNNGVLAGAWGPVPAGAVGSITGAAYLNRCGVVNLNPRNLLLQFSAPVTFNHGFSNLIGNELRFIAASPLPIASALADVTLSTTNAGGGFTILNELPVLSTPPRKSLQLSQTTSNAVVLSWDDPANLLEQADHVQGPWTTMYDASSPITIPLVGSGRFFRLRTGSLASNPGFTAGNAPGQMPGPGQVAGWQAAYGNPQVFNLQGSDDRGFVRLSGNALASAGIRQTLAPANRIKAGHNYIVSFSARFVPCDCGVPAPYAKVRAVAFNGAFPSGASAPGPGPDLSIIDITGPFTGTQWTTVFMMCWRANKDFDSIALSVENNETGPCSSVDIDDVSLMETLGTCPCEEASVDGNGNVIFPSDLDLDTPPTYEDVDLNTGAVTDLYGQFYDTSTATWYPTNSPCFSIGGTVPGEALNVPVDQILNTNLSVTTVQLSNYLSSAASNAVLSFQTNTAFWPNVGAVPTYTYTNSAPVTNLGGAFCGLDIVFIHGYRTTPIFDAALLKTGKPFLVWPDHREEFYDNYQNNGIYGYWKQGAENYWTNHIRHFLINKGRKNRYLIAAHAATQGFEYGTAAIFGQISDAMNTGQGVVFDPADPRQNQGFGAKGYVIVSHSDGGLQTDVAMSIANKTRNHGSIYYAAYGDASYICDHAVAHISFAGAFSGGNLATVLYAISARFAPLEDLCQLMYDLPTGTKFTSVTAAILNGETRDMVPEFAQTIWGPFVSTTPVRTITFAGGHPSAYGLDTKANPPPLGIAADLVKLKILHGFDDGVLNMDSQTANPTLHFLTPSVYVPIPSPLNCKVYDMGLDRQYRKRAVAYYLEQTYDANSLFGVTAASVPDLSPVGMIQPVLFKSLPFRNSLNRYPNHYSVLMSSADHFWGSTPADPTDFVWPYNYEPTHYHNKDGTVTTLAGDYNSEEVYAVTDTAVFSPPPVVPPISVQCPLVNPGIQNLVRETIKGKKVGFTIKIFKKRISKSWWIWKRTYHRLDGFESKNVTDYVYENVLH